MLRIEDQDQVIAAVLEDAAGLIAKGWTTGTAARDATGHAVWVGSEGAVCWCAGGAIDRAAHIAGGTGLGALSTAQLTAGCRAAVATVTKVSISNWNDNYALGALHVQGVLLDVARRLRRGDAELSSAVALAVRTGETGEEVNDDELPF